MKYLLQMMSLICLVSASSVWAGDAPSKWQVSKAGANTPVRITHSVIGGPLVRYSPDYAWISGNDQGLSNAEVVLYCAPGGRERKIAVRDTRLITDAGRVVKFTIDGETMSIPGQRATLIFDGVGNYWGFKASDRLIAALKSGATVSVMISTKSDFDLGEFTLSGSSRAIQAAFRKCG